MTGVGKRGVVYLARWKRRLVACVFLAVAIIALFGLAATPASAKKAHEHGTAQACADCHVKNNVPPTNSECAAACHAGFKALSGQLCYSCHAPEQVVTTWQTSAGCSQQCHLWDPAAKTWTVVYTHGATPHNGADYLPCLNCHTVAPGPADPGTSKHHDAVDSATPGCVGCHDGTPASAVSNHDSVTPVCTACHTNMDRPAQPGSCLTCHSSVAHPEAKQISFTNNVSCSAAACHGASVRHDSTPALGKTCTDCHTAHYQSLGSCTKCHTAGQAYHHGTATATPLVNCASCHDGTPASAKANHDSVAPVCTACHTGMNKPAIPASCNTCHLAASFGAGSCTSSSCHTSASVHTATPGLGKVCTDCHTTQASGHFTGLGSCTTCHTNVAGYHHLGAPTTPIEDCSTCHDGTPASAKTNHDGLTDCESCHSGMDKPTMPANCTGCHSSVAHPEAKQIAYTNDLACANAACHGAGIQHDATPALGTTCTDCHTAQATGHNEGFGTCTSCHTDIEGYHHGTATAGTGTCAGCHTDKTNHDGLTTCAGCHTGMDRPPQPATCSTCHAAATFGTNKCTMCHSSGGLLRQEQVHSSTPQSPLDCTDCHSYQVTGHYESLGDCTICHVDSPRAHHVGPPKIPLSQCTTCHDGSPAAAKVNHDGITDCRACHKGMDKPSMPATCNSCHAATSFGTSACAVSGCHGTDVMHDAMPQLEQGCVDCHAAHYQDSGDCSSCHEGAEVGHHDALTARSTTITLNGPDRVAFGRPVLLAGSLASSGAPRVGVSVTIAARAAGETAFTPITTAVTGSGGLFTAQVQAGANTTFRAVVPGTLAADSVWGPAVAERAVEVSARVTLKLSGQTSRAGRVWRYPLGYKVRVLGTVTPSHTLLGDGTTPGRVTLVTYKRSGSNKWVRTGTATVKLSSSSRFSTSLRPKARGSYRLVAILPLDSDHAGGSSVYRYFQVY